MGTSVVGVIQYVQAERTSLSENAHPAQTHEWTKHSCIEYFWMLPLSEETSSIRHALSVEGSLRACFCSVPFCSFPTVESVRDARAPPHVPARSAAGGDRSAPPSAPAPRPDRRGPVARFEYKMLVLPTTTEKLSPFLFFVHESQGHYYSATYFRAGGRGRAGHVREKRRAITEGCPLSNLVPRDEVTILAPRETSRYEGLCFLTPGRKFSSSLLLLSLVPRPLGEISLVDHA